ncbi:hypothetical protein M721_10250, partial [Neisseria gonorrhoeae ALB_2011_03_03]
MKIFWRIFMRQISLTDYFCKGLGLRAQTLATIAAVRELLNSGQTPPPDYGKRCK